MPSEENETLGDSVSELQHIKKKLDTIIENQEAGLAKQDVTNGKLDNLEAQFPTLISNQQIFIEQLGKIIELLTPSKGDDVAKFNVSADKPTNQ
jgi:hypothetical protein